MVSWSGSPSFGILPVFSSRMYPSGEAAPIAVDLPCGWLDARMDGRDLLPRTWRPLQIDEMRRDDSRAHSRCCSNAECQSVTFPGLISDSVEFIFVLVDSRRGARCDHASLYANSQGPSSMGLVGWRDCASRIRLPVVQPVGRKIWRYVGIEYAECTYVLEYRDAKNPRYQSVVDSMSTAMTRGRVSGIHRGSSQHVP